MPAETYGFDPGWTTDLGVHHQANPASLQGVLASIPGLSSYLAMDQYLRQRNQAERYQPQNDEMRQIVLDTHRAALEKAKNDASLGADLQTQIQAGGGTITPAMYRAMGTRNVLSGNHSAAAPLFQEADRQEKLLQDQAALAGMKSSPQVLAVGEAGPNVPAAAKPGGMPPYLLNSPHVGESAKALQQRIDAGMIPTGAVAEKLIENLGKSHDAMAQAKAILGQRGEQAGELLTQRGEQRLNVTGGRESVYVQRMMMGANQASKDLANVVQLPLTASTGIFGGRKQGPGLFDAGREVLANKATGQEAQAYNAMATGFQRSLAQIESAGLMPSGSLTHQMDAVLFKEGDTNLTKLHKLAQTRQIVEAGMEVVDANPRVSPEEKAKVKGVLESIRKSVPFTHSDLIQLQEAQRTDPNATLGSIMKNKSSGWSIRPR